MTVYKLTANTVADAAATLDIQDDGVIEGVLINMRATLNADTENMNVEVSFASVSGFTANDTRASFAGMSLQAGMLTSGGLTASENLFISMNIPVSGGERIYIHTAGTAAALDRVSVWLFVADGRVADRAGRVRRGGRP